MDDIKPKALEEKLKSQLSLLEFEHVIFERMVYKNKNQHRRCSYFQYLLKVRRELRLLRTANMVEILRPCFHVISGKGSKLQVLESLKLKKSDTGKPNILERLLGALRLLSQMTEPILNAASGISTLLACSFFIPSSLTFLALLARLRVLIQQILLDAVYVFNSVASTSLKKQSVKIAEDRVEVFREFYPKDKECITFLECVWKTDKYVLLETLQNHESSKPVEENVSGDATTRGSVVQYQTSVSSLGKDLSPLLEADNGGVTLGESSTPIAEAASSMTNNALQPEVLEKVTTRECSIQYQTSIAPLGEDVDFSPLLEAEEDDGVTTTESSTLIAEADPSKTNDGSQTEDSEKPEDESSNPVTVIPAKINTDKIKPRCRATKVAFLPLKRHSSTITPNAIEEPPRKKQETGEKDKKEEKEDGFYNLLIRGSHKDSLF
uniref:Nucleolus and neural progenitor protein-like N-terminal domain-containing protein n=1 Tax=Noccaea caerulescens TaxID=107243 RepID=A0A1J3I803_NOCCA